MDRDIDADAYDDINLDELGRPLVPKVYGQKRPPIPLPKGSATPPISRVGPPPPLRKTASLKESGAPPLPPLNNRGRMQEPSKESPTAGSSSPLRSAHVIRSNTFSNERSAPPRPPKPISFDDLVIKPKKRKSPSMKDYILDSEEMSPDHFVQKHQDEFPLKVRVCKGFYGHSERTSVSEGDTFNIHFVKHAKVVHMLDGGGATYKIALNSALEFGLMYDPNNKRDEALNGFVFEKVSDVLAAKVLPKAMRAGVGWRGSSVSSSVEHNEMLIVKGVKKKLNSKLLKVFSPSTGKKKELPESCVGKFSTRPYDVRFFLPEIVENIADPLPCQTMLFVHSETAHELPSHLVTSVVTLTKTSVETSLIATNTDVDDFTDAPMMDVPLDLDIEFQVLHYRRREDTEQLYSDTRTLLEHFNPTKVSRYVSNISSNDYSTQTAFTSMVREENALTGVDIVKPPTIYYNTSSLVSSTDTHSSTTSDQEPIYEMEPGVKEDIVSNDQEKRLTAVEQTLKEMSTFQSNSTQISRQITSARADMKRLENRAVKATEDVGTMKEQLAELSSSVDSLRGIVNTLQNQVRGLQQQGVSGGGGQMDVASRGPSTAVEKEGTYYIIPPLSERPGPVVPRSPSMSSNSSPMHKSAASIPESVCEENRQFLASLDYMQVLQLLELMGLKAYQEMFMMERINGEMLLECDDEVLQDELKVASKLRRVRLLKIISGRHSAEQILKGEDPYVYASPH